MCLLQAYQSIGWPNDSQKYDIYTNEEEMYELLRKGYTTSSFQVNRQKQKTLEDTASMCCFLMFDSSLVISHMRWKLKVLQAVSGPLRLQMRPINRKF